MHTSEHWHFLSSAARDCAALSTAACTCNEGASPVRLATGLHSITKEHGESATVFPRMQVRSAASDSESIAAAGGSGGRVELLPVQWRKGLDLGVRPSGVLPLRLDRPGGLQTSFD